MDIIEQNRLSDLYFVDGGRIIFIPMNWCDDFRSEEGDVYGWIGQESVSNWKSRESKEWYTFEAQGWVSLDTLGEMKQVSFLEATVIDPELFRLLEAVNSGVAV